MPLDWNPGRPAAGPSGLAALRREAFDGLASAGRDWSDRQVCEEALAHLSELAGGTSADNEPGRRLWQVALRLRLARRRHTALAAAADPAADPVGGVVAALERLVDELAPPDADPLAAAERAATAVRLELALLLPTAG